jgi:hypothetical protein
MATEMATAVIDRRFASKTRRKIKSEASTADLKSLTHSRQFGFGDFKSKAVPES